MPITELDKASAVDDYDGQSVSVHSPGDELPGGCWAWERLGVGHRCETWLAWSAALWSPVVAKFPRPHQRQHPRARRAVQREVAALAGNLHPGVPRLLVDGTASAVPYLVLEHIKGSTLDCEVEDHGAFDPIDTALLGTQLLAALRSVHRRGLVHVDLKPDNVMLSSGRPVLLDFGSARAIGAKQPSGRPIGSPGYAAPDLEAGDPISAAMDVYGLGATMYEMLAGRAAFDPDLDAADRPAPAPLPTSPVAHLVHAMLAVDPTSRPDVPITLRELGRICAAAGREAWPAWAEPSR